MRTAIDKAGRLVIPAAVRVRLGLSAGTVVELTVEDLTLRLARAAPPPKLVRVGRLVVARPSQPAAERPRLDPALLVDEERS